MPPCANATGSCRRAVAPCAAPASTSRLGRPSSAWSDAARAHVSVARVDAWAYDSVGCVRARLGIRVPRRQVVGSGPPNGQRCLGLRGRGGGAAGRSLWVVAKKTPATASVSKREVSTLPGAESERTPEEVAAATKATLREAEAKVVATLSERARKTVYKEEKRRRKVKKKALRRRQEALLAERAAVEAKEELRRQLTMGAATLGVGLTLWQVPQDVFSADGYHLLVVFLTTTLGLVLRPLPLGATALLGLLTSVVLHTLTFSQAFGVFSNPLPWQTLSAFLFARGVKKSNLGIRAAYMLVAAFGRTPLSLSYSLVLGETLLSCAVPSKSARGAVFAPLISSIAGPPISALPPPPTPTPTFTSSDSDSTLSDMSTIVPSASAATETTLTIDRGASLGRFLTLSQYQSSAASSALVLTGTPFSLLSAKLATEYLGDRSITWGSWITASCVPVLALLVLTPALSYWLFPPPPDVRLTSEGGGKAGANRPTKSATAVAKKELKKLGDVSTPELIVMGALSITIGLWAVGEQTFGINNATASLCGVSLLLLGGVLSWDDCLSERSGWDCFLWFSIMIALASGLESLGVMQVVSASISGSIAATGTEWPTALACLLGVYTYSHYFFASTTAQVSLMYPAFLAVAVACGTPPYPAALSLAMASHLMSSLTHYSSGNSPIFFNLGYCDMKTWWTAGLVTSLAQGAVWVVVGGAWWRVLGYWDAPAAATLGG